MKTHPEVSLKHARRLWLQLQGFHSPRGSLRLTKRTFREHLERTGALQLDSVNVLDRAHYLTLWSRFGNFDRKRIDGWTWHDGLAFEYWGHEASIRPIAHLPLARRRMRRFPGRWKKSSWWHKYETSSASKRRVLRRLREEGPLESTNFERTPEKRTDKGFHWGDTQLPKEDKRSLKLLWHAGKVAVRERRHFRCVYDLAERVYPDGDAVSPAAFEDSWLLLGLAGNGIASEKHLVNYLTTPELNAAARKRIIARHLKRGTIVEVRVAGTKGTCFALPEHLERLDSVEEPTGTTLISPFDSLLWQRGRAEEWLGFEYRIEIYVPEKKRKFGYYVLPILHDGRLVGRLDPKLHREREELEIKGIWLEPGFKKRPEFNAGLSAAIDELAVFVGAKHLTLPRAWRRLL